MDAEALPEETKKESTDKVPVHPAAICSTKRPRREDRNRKDDKHYDMYMKTVNAAPPAEQLNIASQKYLAMLDENKKLQFYIKQSDKRHALIMKEKEQLQLEFNKSVLLKSKLENLCRELQKQNKSIKEESLHKIREEEERRKETQAKFQSTLAEITALLQQNNDKNAKLRDDNISMTEKFKTVVQQYQLREDQVEKMSKQMELESQLNAAKMQKASLEHQAERERMLVEMEMLKAAVAEYRGKLNDMAGTETGLRGQLAVYTDKYDEFQSALVKSNQVFGGFKEQMEKMSKKIKKLEKESLSWKQRWESSQSALLDMCGERQSRDARLLAVQRQLAHMQSLCRTLQGERTVLLSTLKENNIERPPLPAPAPVPEPEPPAPAPARPSASDDKVDAMAMNCAQLKQSLAHLQSQLNVLTTQQNQPAEDTAQADKPKKTKNKKNKSKKASDDAKEASVEPKEVSAESKELTDEVENPAAETTEAIKEDPSAIVNNGILDNTEAGENAAVVKTGAIEGDLSKTVDNELLDDLMDAIGIGKDDNTAAIATEVEAIATVNGVDSTTEVKKDSPKQSPTSSPKKNSPKASPKKVNNKSVKLETQVTDNCSNSEAKET